MNLVGKKDEGVKELDGEKYDNTKNINYMMANAEKIMKAKEKVSLIDKIKSIRGIGIIIKPAIEGWEKLWKALSKEEKPLLLGERRRRKKRRQKIVGVIKLGSN